MALNIGSLLAGALGGMNEAQRVKADRERQNMLMMLEFIKLIKSLKSEDADMKLREAQLEEIKNPKQKPETVEDLMKKLEYDAMMGVDNRYIEFQKKLAGAKHIDSGGRGSGGDKFNVNKELYNALISEGATPKEALLLVSGKGEKASKPMSIEEKIKTDIYNLRSNPYISDPNKIDDLSETLRLMTGRDKGDVNVNLGSISTTETREEEPFKVDPDTGKLVPNEKAGMRYSITTNEKILPGEPKKPRIKVKRPM